MKKVKNIFHKIANADPMIWGYVILCPFTGFPLSLFIHF